MALWLQIVVFALALFSKEIYQANEEAIVAAMFLLCILCGYQLIGNTIASSIFGEAKNTYTELSESWDVKKNVFIETSTWYSYIENLLMSVQAFSADMRKFINETLSDSSVHDLTISWERNIIATQIKTQLTDILNKELIFTRKILKDFTDRINNNLYKLEGGNALLDSQISRIEKLK